MDLGYFTEVRGEGFCQPGEKYNFGQASYYSQVKVAVKKPFQGHRN